MTAEPACFSNTLRASKHVVTACSNTCAAAPRCRASASDGWLTTTACQHFGQHGSETWPGSHGDASARRLAFANTPSIDRSWLAGKVCCSRLVQCDCKPMRQTIDDAILDQGPPSSQSSFQVLLSTPQLQSRWSCCASVARAELMLQPLHLYCNIVSGLKAH